MWSKNAEQVVTNWRQFACGNNGLHGIRNLQQKNCVVKYIIINNHFFLLHVESMI